MSHANCTMSSDKFSPPSAPCSAARKSTLPQGSPLRHRTARSPRDRAEHAANRERSLSQALHPVMLDEAGLESNSRLVSADRGKADRHYHIRYEKSGDAVPVVRARAAVQRLPYCARGFEQRHPPFRGSKPSLGAAALSSRIAGPGNRRPTPFFFFVAAPGFPPSSTSARGIGLVAMRERAQTGRMAEHRDFCITHNRRHAGKVSVFPERPPRTTCLKKFPCCWWTTMPWSVKASAACSRMKPTWFCRRRSGRRTWTP